MSISRAKGLRGNYENYIEELHNFCLFSIVRRSVRSKISPVSKPPPPVYI